MAGLTHPNTVEVYDYGQAEDGTFYYVMEYLPGPNLENLITEKGQVSPERAIHILRQICGALREAHGVGLLHRDIKPSNIILCERGGVPDVAKLLDYGLVQNQGLAGSAENPITLQGSVLGSPPYMSPEQAAGKANLDTRSDIYALGGVAYFLLTGRQPFVRETPMEILLAHAYEPVQPPSELRPDLPADLQGVILRCLCKKPEERYESVEALDGALAECHHAGKWNEQQARIWWQTSGMRDSPTSTEISAAITTPPATRIIRA
jgi:serine/threonine-protein kinase